MRNVTEKLAADIDIRSQGVWSVKITPEAAKKWLETLNLGNRRVKPTLVMYLLDQIKSGEWQADHPQPLIFSSEGRLIDGQHRLHAIMRSGQTLTMLAMTGVRDGLREYIDTGINRSLEDRVAFDVDLKTNRYVARIVTSFYAIEHNGSFRRPSPEEAKTVFDKHHDGIIFACAFLRKTLGKISRAPVAIALCELHERSNSKAIEFEQALSVIDGGIRSATMLRENLLRRIQAGGRNETLDCYGKSVAAMKAYLEDREISVLRYTKW